MLDALSAAARVVWVAAEEHNDASCPRSIALVALSGSSARRSRAPAHGTDESESLWVPAGSLSSLSARELHWRDRFIGAIASFIGAVVSFTGAVVSFTGAVVSFTGAVVSFTGAIGSFTAAIGATSDALGNVSVAMDPQERGRDRVGIAKGSMKSATRGARLRSARVGG